MKFGTELLRRVEVLTMIFTKLSLVNILTTYTRFFNFNILHKKFLNIHYWFHYSL